MVSVFCLIMPNVLDVQTRRPFAGDPVEVKVTLRISQFLEVNEAEQTFKMNCFFKQSWTDSRIQYPKNISNDLLILRSEWREKIWQPTTYFFNAVDGT